MSKQRWPTGEEEQSLIERRQDGETIDSIALSIGLSPSTVGYHLSGVIPLPNIEIPMPNYSAGAVHIEGPCMLTSDWHSPYYDPRLVHKLVYVARKLKIRQLAIVGDFTDLKKCSRYLQKDWTHGTPEELEYSLNLLQFLFGWFQRIYWSMGNHEDRLIDLLKGYNIFPQLTREFSKGRLILTDRTTMFLDNTWRLEHPKAYSRNAAQVAATLAAKFHKNIASAHGHFIGYHHDISGQYIGVDLGGMFDVRKQEYLYKGGATTHPTWNPGFWVYKNFRVRPFEDALINWEEWGVPPEYLEDEGGDA